MGLSEERQKMLDTAISQIEKKRGKGSIFKMGESDALDMDRFSSGSISVDLALGGGYPVGRIVELYGPESSGKTTAALEAVKSVQEKGGIAAYVDAEHALDPNWAERIGVNIDDLYIAQPDSGEAALDITEMLVNSGAVDLIVVDSVAALTPEKELAGEMGDTNVGLQARLMSQALRKITGAANNTKTTVIFINQLREKIGVFFGSPETTTGGKALKFYASIRIDIRRIETLKEGGNPIGNRVRLKIVKNKTAAPFRQAEVDLLYEGGAGFNLASDVRDRGVEIGEIKKSGAWFTYEGQQLGQGKENARLFLETNPDVLNEIKDKIIESFNPTPDLVPEDLDSEEKK